MDGRLEPFKIEEDFAPLSGVWALGLYSRLGATDRKHRTEVGTLLNQSKYATAETKTSEDAFAALSVGLADLVRETPEIDPTRLAWIPGHEPGEASFSELLGEDLAHGLDVPGVPLQRRLPAGSSQKEKPGSMVGVFQLDRDLSGERVLVVDDVLNTGNSMRGAGQAVMSAGAVVGWGIVAARRI